jgi:hypothetical protein
MRVLDLVSMVPIRGSALPVYMAFFLSSVDSICFYHFYVPITHPSIIAKIIVLFLYCFGC